MGVNRNEIKYGTHCRILWVIDSDYSITPQNPQEDLWILIISGIKRINEMPPQAPL